MKSSKVNWLETKSTWQKELSKLYDEQESSNILLILAEEVLPHYPAISFRDAFFTILPGELLHLGEYVKQLIEGMPLQYVLKKAWFYDIELKVNEHVLIPRPETEELVTWILENSSKEAAILDIGTGSGCIPLTLKKHMPNAEISAIDLDIKALNVAKENAELLDLDIAFSVCDILNEETRSKLKQYDIIVSNPPYIPISEKELMQNNVLNHEPHLALFVEDNDSLIFYDEIALFAKKHLKQNGLLFFECNEFNAKAVVQILTELTFKNIELKKDLQGKDRMIKCTL